MKKFKLNDIPDMGNTYNQGFNNNYGEHPYSSNTNANNYNESPTKFCKFCGEKIHIDAIVCVKCGRQVEILQNGQERVVINNVNTNSNIYGYGNPKSKLVSLLLCFFLGYIGAHKFYEGKFKMGLLYLVTVGLFGVGILFDFIALIFKPNTYYI